MEKPNTNLLIKVVISLLILFGLWISLHYTFNIWGPDSDECFPAMLWQGIHRYGLKFIPYATFVPDNYLFSLIFPIYFVLFYIFGVNGYVIVLIGWLIFIFSAFLTGYIIKKATDNNISALIGIVLSLFVGIYNSPASWFVYSISHNITMLWALIGITITISIYLNKNRKKKILYFLLFFLVIFIASISDPWFNSAFNVPIFITLSIFYFKEHEYRFESKILIPLTLLAWFVSLPISFAYRFVPSLHQLKENIKFYLISIANFLNIAQAFSIAKAFGVVFLLLSILMLYIIVVKLYKFYNKLMLTIIQKFIFIFFILSILVISAAFLLSNFPHSLRSLRFLYNIFYGLIILSVSFLSLTPISKKEKTVIISYIIFYILVGIGDQPKIWLNPEIKLKSLGVENIISQLESNNLHFGYGDYWTSQANAISVLTDGRITVVGIIGMSDPFAPHGFSNQLYFNNRYIPKEKYYFIIIPNSPTSEWRLSLENSIEDAKYLFGQPIKIIHLKNHTILVWDHPLDFYSIKLKEFSRVFKAVEAFISKGNSLSNLYPQYLEEQGYLDKSFGYNKGPAKNWTKTGIWVGKWSCPDGKEECFAIGLGGSTGTIKGKIKHYLRSWLNSIFKQLGGSIEKIKPIIEKYKSQALKIYFPYPKVYNENNKDEDGQLLVIFRVPKLKPIISTLPYTIDFKSDGNAKIFESSGFCKPENWGTWSCAKEISINFDLRNFNKKPLFMVIDFTALATSNHPQEFYFYLNGNLLKKLTVTNNTKNHVVFNISKYAKSHNILVIKIPYATTPKSLGINNDTKTLGIGLIRLIITDKS